MRGGGSEPAGIGDLLQRLLDDAAEVARAEIAVQRARMIARIGNYRTAALLFAIAGMLGFATVIALMVGLIIALAPSFGAGGATALVCGAALIVTIALAMLARGNLAGVRRGRD